MIIFSPQKFAEIKKKLSLTLKSDHFVVRYGLRNPTQGRGLGASGVSDRGLLLTYIHALERLYQVMISPPWKRPELVRNSEEKIQVYVFAISELVPGDGSPFAGTTSEGLPFVCLPSGSVEPSAHAEMLRAAAEAVHEATHIFNSNQQEERGLNSNQWDWFDEAIAVFMETHLIPGNHDHLRFLKNWIDIPETPLDDWAARYQAGMFVYYLEKRDPGSANRVWMESLPKETPIETMIRLRPGGQTFVSYDPDEKDLFASGYCLDSYFLWDHNSLSLAPELFVRYGERSITESFVIRSGGQARSDRHRVDHLACRYFRFYLKGDVKKLVVRLSSAPDQKIAPIKAELATVSLEKQRGDHVVTLRPEEIKGEKSETVLFADLTEFDTEELDHFVLVVSNCGTRARQPNLKKPHDDDRSFEITISAE